MDSKALFLTPNTTSIYVTCWLDLKDGPTVIETPPNVLGFINDFWFHYVTDFGNVGPDKGKGGKFLILPPGYEGRVPKGYHVVQSDTYGNWVLIRGFQVNGDTSPAVSTIKKHFRIYPLSQANKTHKMNFINVSGKSFNTIHAMNHKIFDEINEVVQEEPPQGQNPEILGILASIGIKKGQRFKPTSRMKKILKEAADVGAATVRALTAYPRNDSFYLYPGQSFWATPFPGGSHEFLDHGATILDGRALFHFYATGITPAMTKSVVGKGSSYAMTYRDSDGNPLDGSKSYKIHLSPNVPAKDFWSFVAYDNQTRSMLQTDQQFPSVSNAKDIKQNSDGSYDIYFGPTLPKGFENNWIQTIPGKGWNSIFRLYGPLQPWFDKSWKLNDPEIIQ